MQNGPNYYIKYYFIISDALSRCLNVVADQGETNVYAAW